MTAIFQAAFSNAFFVNENVWFSIELSLTFIPEGPIKNIPALVQIMAGQATSHCLYQCWLHYWRMFASLGLNKLTQEIVMSYF